MDLRVNLANLDTPQDILKLTSILAELADSLDVMYTETSPNATISARIGRIAIYKNGTSYETWQNTDGSTTWQRIDSGAYVSPLTKGDWIVSSVTTARAGWTNVSSTYSNKFMRINATPLATGGADTVTISANNLPEHTHAVGTLHAENESAHTHVVNGIFAGGGSETNETTTAQSGHNTAVSTAGGSAHTHTLDGATAVNTTTATAINTVPAYISVCIFQKD